MTFFAMPVPCCRSKLVDRIEGGSGPIEELAPQLRQLLAGLRNCTAFHLGNARAFAGALERAQDVQEVGVIALLAGRDAVVLEALPRVVLGIEAGAPAFVAEGRIGDDVVEGLERVAVEEERASDGVALLDLRRGVVVQDHVHAREASGGVVFLLPVERDLHVLVAVAGFVADLEEQRARAAGRVIDGGVVADLGVADAEDLRDDAAHFGGGVELALTLATLGGEVPHEVFVGVAEKVVAVGAI